MGTKRAIRAEEIIKAMKAGIADTQLMVKFNLSPPQFQTVVQKMKQRGLLSGARPDRSNSNSAVGLAGIPPGVSDRELPDPQESLREQVEAALDRLIGAGSVGQVKSNP